MAIDIRPSATFQKIIDIEDEVEQAKEIVRYVNSLERKIATLNWELKTEKEKMSNLKKSNMNIKEESDGWKLPSNWQYMSDDERRGWAGSFS